MTLTHLIEILEALRRQQPEMGDYEVWLVVQRPVGRLEIEPSVVVPTSDGRVMIS